MGAVHYHAMGSGDADYDQSSIRKQRALRGTNIRILKCPEGGREWLRGSSLLPKPHPQVCTVANLPGFSECQGLELSLHIDMEHSRDSQAAQRAGK